MALTDTAPQGAQTQGCLVHRQRRSGGCTSTCCPPADIRSVVWRKKEQGFDAAAGQIRGLLKRMLDYAVTCGLLNHNPVTALPMRHVYRMAARDRALMPEEIQLFLRSARASSVRRQFKIALHLILMTLVRKSELMLPQWKDVHLDEAE